MVSRQRNPVRIVNLSGGKKKKRYFSKLFKLKYKDKHAFILQCNGQLVQIYELVMLFTIQLQEKNVTAKNRSNLSFICKKLSKFTLW